MPGARGPVDLNGGPAARTLRNSKILIFESRLRDSRGRPLLTTDWLSRGDGTRGEGWHGVGGWKRCASSRADAPGKYVVGVDASRRRASRHNGPPRVYHAFTQHYSISPATKFAEDARREISTAATDDTSHRFPIATKHK